MPFKRLLTKRYLRPCLHRVTALNDSATDLMFKKWHLAWMLGVFIAHLLTVPVYMTSHVDLLVIAHACGLGSTIICWAYMMLSRTMPIPVVYVEFAVLALEILALDLHLSAINGFVRVWPCLFLLYDMVTSIGMSWNTMYAIAALTVVWMTLMGSARYVDYGLYDMPYTDNPYATGVDDDLGPSSAPYSLSDLSRDVNVTGVPSPTGAGEEQHWRGWSPAFEARVMWLQVVIFFAFGTGFVCLRSVGMHALGAAVRTEMGLRKVNGIVEALAYFRLDEAEWELGRCQEEIPVGLAAVLHAIIANLRSYKPYLPESCLENSSRDAGMQFEVFSPRDCYSIVPPTLPSMQPQAAPTITLPSVARAVSDVSINGGDGVAQTPRAAPSGTRRRRRTMGSMFSVMTPNDSTSRKSSHAESMASSVLTNDLFGWSSFQVADPRSPARTVLGPEGVGVATPAHIRNRRKSSVNSGGGLGAALLARPVANPPLKWCKMTVLHMNMHDTLSEIEDDINSFTNKANAFISATCSTSREFRGNIDFYAGDTMDLSFNAARSCALHGSAALNTARAVLSIPLVGDVSCGAASGFAYCGDLGGSDFKRWTLLGKPPLFAAAFAKLARNIEQNIVCDQALATDCAHNHSIRLVMQTVVFVKKDTRLGPFFVYQVDGTCREHTGGGGEDEQRGVTFVSPDIHGAGAAELGVAMSPLFPDERCSLSPGQGVMSPLAVPAGRPVPLTVTYELGGGRPASQGGERTSPTVPNILKTPRAASPPQGRSPQRSPKASGHMAGRRRMLPKPIIVESPALGPVHLGAPARPAVSIEIPKSHRTSPHINLDQSVVRMDQSMFTQQPPALEREEWMYELAKTGGDEWEAYNTAGKLYLKGEISKEAVLQQLDGGSENIRNCMALELSALGDEVRGPLEMLL